MADKKELANKKPQDLTKKETKTLVKEGQKAIKNREATRKRLLDIATAPFQTSLKIASGFRTFPLPVQIGVGMLALRWIRQAREERESQKDLQDAIKFLRESRGFTDPEAKK